MNKFESKYFNTAQLLNQALIELLNKKDYEFITIKELCKKAGVNRSTFYLHYDTLNDLLYETIDNTNKKFLSFFDEAHSDVIANIKSEQKSNLILITPEYLQPYLTYIEQNKVVYQVSARYPKLMQSITKYNLLKENVLYPIFKRFNIQESQQKYFSAYYINGIYAIIDEWLKSGCTDSKDLVMDAIIKCVRPFEESDENKKNNY